MSLKEHFMNKLRIRIWKNSRSIIRLRRRALDTEKYARFALHDEIDELKLAREQDVLKLEELCQEEDSLLEEVKAGVEEVVDDVKHSIGNTPVESR